MKQKPTKQVPTGEKIKVPKKLIPALSPLQQDILDFLLWRGLAIVVDDDGEDMSRIAAPTSRKDSQEDTFQKTHMGGFLE